MANRGVSPVLGMALLVGFTAIVSLSVLVVSVAVVDSTQSSAETSQVERSMTALAEAAASVATSDVRSSSFAIQGGSDGSVEVDPDAGSYEVRIDRANGTEVLTSGDLGAYVYHESDGTSVAFQGGGVWRAEAGGPARTVESPEFHYRSRPDPTLTLPIVRLEGSAAPRRGRLVVQDRRAVYPVRPDHENPLSEGVVLLEVESEFCAGWQEYFRGRTDGAVVDDCASTDETAPGGVLVRLSVPFRFDGIGSDTAVAQRVTGQGTVHGSTSEGVHGLESASGVVEHHVEQCADGEGQPLRHSVAGGGRYCASGMSGNYVVDTRGEDVQLVVDGVANPDELEIRGDGTVTLFARDDVLRMPAGDVGNPSRPEQLRIVVHSDAQVGELPGGGGGRGGGRGGPGAGNLDLYALIYAPNSVVSFAGNADVHGGVVADRLHLQSAASDVYGAPAVGDVVLEFERGGEPFYFLHVSETTVTIEQ